MVHILEGCLRAGCGDEEGTPPGLQREELLNGDLQGKQVLGRGQTEQDARGTCQVQDGWGGRWGG